jgi:hypothetical protein
MLGRAAGHGCHATPTDINQGRSEVAAVSDKAHHILLDTNEALRSPRAVPHPHTSLATVCYFSEWSTQAHRAEQVSRKGSCREDRGKRKGV